MRTAGKCLQFVLTAAAPLLPSARSEAAPTVSLEREGGSLGLPPELLNAAAAYVQSCRFAVDPAGKGKRTDTTYGKLLLKTTP